MMFSTETTSGDGPSGRADQLIAMTSRLTELVSGEIKALRERRLDGASADWDDKERLVHAWRLEVGRVKSDPSLLAGIDTDRKTALRNGAQALEAALEGHALALSAMKHVTEGLVRSIAAEIASARGAPQAYGRSGTVNSGSGAGGSGESSGIAVNARV